MSLHCAGSTFSARMKEDADTPGVGPSSSGQQDSSGETPQAKRRRVASSPSQTVTVTFDDLPTEILETIFQQVGFPGRNAVACVCQRWRAVAAIKTHVVRPGQSLETAFAHVEDGDSIAVLPGFYEEVVEVPKCVRIYSAEPGPTFLSPFEPRESPIGAVISGVASGVPGPDSDFGSDTEKAEEWIEAAVSRLTRARSGFMSNVQEAEPRVESSMASAVAGVENARQCIEELADRLRKAKGQEHGQGWAARGYHMAAELGKTLMDTVARAHALEVTARQLIETMGTARHYWGLPVQHDEEFARAHGPADPHAPFPDTRATVQAPMGTVAVLVSAKRARFERMCFRVPETNRNRSIISFGINCETISCVDCEVQGHAGLVVPFTSPPGRSLVLRKCHIQSVMDCPAVIVHRGTLVMEDCRVDQCCEAVVVGRNATARLLRCDFSFNEIGVVFQGSGSICHCVLWGNNALCDGNLAATAFTSQLALLRPVNVTTGGGRCVVWRNWLHRRVRQCYGTPSSAREYIQACVYSKSQRLEHLLMQAYPEGVAYVQEQVEGEDMASETTEPTPVSSNPDEEDEEDEDMTHTPSDSDGGSPDPSEASGGMGWHIQVPWVTHLP